ncbi:MAG: site-2 protease family protein [Christensenellaceae bacterium]|nr:site-2 protease family protein [Christensenellaceae bacterium]
MEWLIEWLQELIYTLPAIIIALSFHEFGHAYAAYKMGDPTARNEGRLTLNPLAHVDPIGMLMMVIFHFGWAKPVPVNPRNYRSYRKGELVVSLAGVTMNLLLACIGALLIQVLITTCGIKVFTVGALQKIYLVLYYFVLLNCCLLVFNLLPIYPLDGFHVAEVLLAKYLGPKPFIFLRKYGNFLLIGIILLGRTGSFSIVGIAANAVANGVMGLFGLIFSLFA